MDLSAFWLALLRRWYFVFVALAISVGSTYYVVDSMGPTFRAEGAALLFPPTTTVVEGTQTETQGNPYLMLGGLTQARDIVMRQINSKSASDEFGNAVPGASYTATQDYTTSSPIIVVTVEAPSKEGAVAGVRHLLDTIPPTLRDLQAEFVKRDSAYITSTELTADTRPETVRKGQIRAGLVVAVLSLAAGLLLIGLLDGLLAARKSKTAPGKRAGGTPPETPPGRSGSRAGPPEPGPSERARERVTSARH